MNRMRKTAVLAAAGAVIAISGTVAASAASRTADPGSTYTATAPVRLLDTRTTTGGHLGALAAGQALTLTVTGTAGVPVDATAVAMNVTVTVPQAGGYLTVYPDGMGRPLASNLNFGAGQTVANSVTVAVKDGAVDLYNGSGGTVQLVADLEGWYTQAPAPYVPPQPITADLGAVASVPTGGGFVANATQVGTLDLKAGTYQVSLNAKATPLLTSGVQVFPQFFVYDQAKNAEFTGDLFNVGSGPLESGGNTNIDSYYSGSGAVTLATDTTLYVYAFGYDSDRGAGSYALDDLTVSAVPID